MPRMHQAFGSTLSSIYSRKGRYTFDLTYFSIYEEARPCLCPGHGCTAWPIAATEKTIADSLQSASTSLGRITCLLSHCDDTRRS